MLLAGTGRGLFLFRSGQDRARFAPRGETLLGLDVADARFDARTGLIYAAAGGRAPGIYVSRDLGRSWTRHGTEIGAPGFTRLTLGHPSAPKTVYAAGESAFLHRTSDAGETWQAVWSLNEHPSRRDWTDGGCPASIRALVQDPRTPDRLWAAVSGAGVFRTEDGGLSWRPVNAGIPSHASRLALFEGLGRCAHNLALSAKGALWLSCHDGVYRSTDGGDRWHDRSRGLPSHWSHALSLLPREDVALLVPESPHALTSNGDLALWVGSNGGRDWQRSGRGLPARAHVGIAPAALVADDHDPAGVYLGTSSGKVFASRDAGRSFTRIAEDLPAVRSLHAFAITE